MPKLTVDNQDSRCALRNEGVLARDGGAMLDGTAVLPDGAVDGREEPETIRG